MASAHTKRAYARALKDFLAWCRSEPRQGFSKAVVHRYRIELESSGLSSATVNLRLAAIRKLALEAADNGWMAPELAAGVARVKGTPRLGIRLGNWLSREQAERLLNSPASRILRGLRDRALLATLLGAGLRRNELAGLEFAQLQEREGRWVIADLLGKHGRVRTVPMASWTKSAIDTWARTAGLNEGRVFRPISKGGRLNGDSMTPQAIYRVVKGYANQTATYIAPHDLRRTFSKLAFKGGAPLEQIRLSLGHASLTTTEKYLGLELDLIDAPCDHIRLRFAELEASS